MGEVGLSLSDFYDATMRDIINIVDGYYRSEERRIKEIEHREQAAWIRTRWATCLVLNTQVKDKLKPRDLATFEWEEPEKPKWTQEQIDRMFEGMK